MQRRTIHRGGISSAAYDRDRKTLDIEFDTHRVVRYENVGHEIAERFLTSASPVSYFHDAIEDEYGSCELGVKSLKDLVDDKTHPKKGVPDELKRLFGES